MGRPLTITTRTCVGCGRRFDGRGRAKWCSERCRKRTLYAGVCIDCGAPTNGSDGRGARASERCRHCGGIRAGELQRARGRLVREQVEQLWAAGRTWREVQAIMGWRTMSASTLRARGYDLPHRIPPDRLARILVHNRVNIVAARAGLAAARAAKARNTEGETA